MEIIQQFTVTDLVVLVTLAGGVFAGFQQGLLRYILNCVSVLVAFVLASQLAGPIADTLNGVWNMGTPEQQELWIYIVLFAAGVIGGWFLVRTFYRQTRLPIIRQLDEIGGAVVGVLYVALIYSFSMVVLDSFFRTVSEDAAAVATILGPINEILNSSFILGLFREYLVPVAGFVVRPFVPDQIEQFLLFSAAPPTAAGTTAPPWRSRPISWAPYWSMTRPTARWRCAWSRWRHTSDRTTWPLIRHAAGRRATSRCGGHPATCMSIACTGSMTA